MSDIIKHDVLTWFGDKTNLLKYFNSEYTRKKIEKFDAPESIAIRFNNLKTVADFEECINTYGNVYINALVTGHPKAKRIFSRIKWEWLKNQEDTIEHLKEYVCDCVQHAMLNRLSYQKMNASTVSTPGFSMSRDSSNWLFQSDMFCMDALGAIKQSGILDYEVEYWESRMYTPTKNGRYKIVTSMSDEEALKYNI